MQSYRQIHLKNFNRIALLNYIRRNGTATRVGLSGVTGLTFMAIRNILQELTDLNLVRLDDRRGEGGRQRSAVYRINENYGYTVGLHINIYETRAAVMNLGGEILARRSCRCAVPDSQMEFVDQITGLVKKTIEDAHVDAGQLLGLGIACPGPLNAESGMVLTPPNYPPLRYLPICSIMESRLGIPALVEKDANAIALGEYWYGAGKTDLGPENNMVYIDADMGIGSGLILGGELYRSCNFQAGEFGHITLDLNGPLCNCGRLGCLEAMASGLAVRKRVAEQLAKLPDHPLYEQRDRLTINDVLQFAGQGDALCVSVLNQSAYYLGTALNSLIHLLDPNRIVLGGVLTKGYHAYFDIVCNTVFPQSFRADGGQTLTRARLGEDAGVIGGGELVAEKFFTEIVSKVFTKEENAQPAVRPGKSTDKQV